MSGGLADKLSTYSEPVNVWQFWDREWRIGLVSWICTVNRTMSDSSGTGVGDWADQLSTHSEPVNVLQFWDMGWELDWTYELTMRFRWELVKLIPRDLGHCPRWRSHRRQSARSQGINRESHPTRVDNSGSTTTVLSTKYLYNDVKCLFLSERWVLFYTVSHLCCFDHVTQTWPNRTIKFKEKYSFGTSALQGVVPWDYHYPAGHSPIGLCPGSL